MQSIGPKCLLRKIITQLLTNPVYCCIRKIPLLQLMSVHFKCFAVNLLGGAEQKEKCQTAGQRCTTVVAVNWQDTGNLFSCTSCLCGVLWCLIICLSSCVALYIASLDCISLFWRAACFHKTCRNVIPQRALALYQILSKLCNGFYNYWKEL